MSKTDKNPYTGEASILVGVDWIKRRHEFVPQMVISALEKSKAEKGAREWECAGRNCWGGQIDLTEDAEQKSEGGERGSHMALWDTVSQAKELVQRPSAEVGRACSHRAAQRALGEVRKVGGLALQDLVST